MESKRLSKEEVFLFDELYLKGVKIKEIARILEISEKGVKKRIERTQIGNRKFKAPEELIDEIIEHWRDRLTVGQIAIKMNLSKHIVHYQLKKLCLVD